MTLKDMVKIKVKVIILLLAWNHTTLLLDIFSKMHSNWRY